MTLELAMMTTISFLTESEDQKCLFFYLKFEYFIIQSLFLPRDILSAPDNFQAISIDKKSPDTLIIVYFVTCGSQAAIILRRICSVSDMKSVVE